MLNANSPIDTGVNSVDGVKSIDNPLTPPSTPPLIVKTGVRPVLVIMLVLITAIVSSVLGYSLSTLSGSSSFSQEVVPTPLIADPELNEPLNVSPELDEEEDEEEEEEWVDYENTEYNFKLTHPEDWNVEMISENLSGATFKIGSELNFIELNILLDWGPELCRYEDTTYNFSEGQFYTEFDNFVEIKGVNLYYRRSYTGEGKYKVCGRPVNSDYDLFSDNVFQGGMPSGSADYKIQEDNVSDEIVLIMDEILSSLDEI